MLDFLIAIAPFVAILLLLVIAFGVHSAYGELINVRQLLLHKYELDKTLLQRSSEANTHAEAMANTLERIEELQSLTAAKVHKIAIHYAPYLRTKRDVVDEAEHRRNIIFDYDIDSRVAQEESGKKDYELNPRDPIEGGVVPESKRY